jgi:hypothetical protein
METKRKCSICKTVKPHCEFVKNSKDKYGISYVWCYACKTILKAKILEKIQCSVCGKCIARGSMKRHSEIPLHTKHEKYKSIVQQPIQISV